MHKINKVLKEFFCRLRPVGRPSGQSSSYPGGLNSSQPSGQVSNQPAVSVSSYLGGQSASSHPGGHNTAPSLSAAGALQTRGGGQGQTSLLSPSARGTPVFYIIYIYIYIVRLRKTVLRIRNDFLRIRILQIGSVRIRIFDKK